jgi:transketolase C-terminal domain/subunit
MHGVMDPAKYRKIRDEFGETVVALGAEIPQMIVLTADLMYPTRTEKFAQLCGRGGAEPGGHRRWPGDLR